VDTLEGTLMSIIGLTDFDKAMECDECKRRQLEINRLLHDNNALRGALGYNIIGGDNCWLLSDGTAPINYLADELDITLTAIEGCGQHGNETKEK
jgi:hypothetical protein